MLQQNATQGNGGGGGDVAVRLEPAGRTVHVPPGTVLEDAISLAGVRVPLPCGGQGRCGRCAVQVREGSVRRRSTIRLTDEEIEQGYALACQTLVGSDATVWVPPEQERLERVAGGDLAEKAAIEVGSVRPPCPPLGLALPPERGPAVSGRQYPGPRTPAARTRPATRVARCLAQPYGAGQAASGATGGRVDRHRRGGTPRRCGGQGGRTRSRPPAAGRAARAFPQQCSRTGHRHRDHHGGHVLGRPGHRRLDRRHLSLQRADCPRRGRRLAHHLCQAAEATQELQDAWPSTINELHDAMLGRAARLNSRRIGVVVVAGNTTMTHLFLGVEPDVHPPGTVRAVQRALAAGARPGTWASRTPRGNRRLHAQRWEPTLAATSSPACYVPGCTRPRGYTLFIDVGHQWRDRSRQRRLAHQLRLLGRTRLRGRRGATSGMRPCQGAIEEVWINPSTLEPTYRVGGDEPPRICGSGMISLLG